MGITIKELSKRFYNQIVLNNLSLSYEKANGIIAITGVSGSGKTTLLSILAGLDKADSGEILLNNLNLTNMDQKEVSVYRNQNVGLVFQSYNLLEEKSILENIIIPGLFSGNKREELIYRAQELCEKMNLELDMNKKISLLSGGEKQRVAIARALINDPILLLADEPTGNLDAENSRKIMEEFKKVAKSKLCIIVSHDIELMKEYSDVIYDLRDGSVIESFNAKHSSFKENADHRINTLEKVKLNFGELYKIAMSNIKNNFKKMYFILPLVISLVVLGISINLGSDFLNNLDSNNKYYYQLDLFNVTKDKENDFFMNYSSSHYNYLMSEDILNLEDQSYVEGVTYDYLGHRVSLVYDGDIIEDLDYKIIENSQYYYDKFDLELFNGELEDDQIIISENLSEILFKNNENIIGTKLILKYGFFGEKEFEIVGVTDFYYVDGSMPCILSQEGIDSLVKSDLEKSYISSFMNYSSFDSSNMDLESYILSNVNLHARYLDYIQDVEDTIIYGQNINESMEENQIIISKQSLIYNIDTLLPNYDGDIELDIDNFSSYFEQISNNTYVFIMDNTENMLFKIVGVYDDTLLATNSQIYTMFISEKMYLQIIEPNPNIAYVYANDIKSTDEVITSLEVDDYDVDYPYGFFLSNLETKTNQIKIVLLIISGLLGSLSVITLNGFMKSYTLSRKKEFTIYQSVGATKNQVFSMFAIELISISLIISIFGIISLYLVSYLTNITIFKDWLVLTLGWVNVMTLIIMTFILILITGTIPISKILKQTPLINLKSDN